jgi:hypothetical protein
MIYTFFYKVSQIKQIVSDVSARAKNKQLQVLAGGACLAEVCRKSFAFFTISTQERNLIEQKVLVTTIKTQIIRERKEKCKFYSELFDC